MIISVLHCANVGWVEALAETHRTGYQLRWVSLRSTHPTNTAYE